MAELGEVGSSKNVENETGDGDVPPLEDMLELIDQSSQLRKEWARNASQGNDPPPAFTPSTNTTEKSDAKDVKPQAKTQKSQPKQSENFGGFKKGFLFGGPPAKKVTPKPTKTAASKPEPIPYIKPKDPEAKSKQFEIPEVQEALKASQGLLDNKEWITDDLMEKVRSHPNLLKKMSDPKCMQAITEFQANPKTAMTKYNDNPEIQQFLKDFCSILGDHFTNMKKDDKSGQNSSSADRFMPPSDVTAADLRPSGARPDLPGPDMANVEKLLDDPDMRTLLMDPEVMKLLSLLNTKPEEAHRMIAEGDPSLKQKIGKLMASGLLQVQR